MSYSGYVDGSGNVYLYDSTYDDRTRRVYTGSIIRSMAQIERERQEELERERAKDKKRVL